MIRLKKDQVNYQNWSIVATIIQSMFLVVCALLLYASIQSLFHNQIIALLIALLLSIACIRQIYRLQIFKKSNNLEDLNVMIRLFFKLLVKMY